MRAYLLAQQVSSVLVRAKSLAPVQAKFQVLVQEESPVLVPAKQPLMGRRKSIILLFGTKNCRLLFDSVLRCGDACFLKLFLLAIDSASGNMFGKNIRSIAKSR